MRIAIVNDLSLAREVLRRLVLSAPGYSIAWIAEDGDEALRKATDDRPDVILMDLVMPRVNGVDATRMIMRQAPCPILVVTATIPGNYELVIRAMGAGALDAVETPSLGPGGAVLNGAPLIARLTKLAAVQRNVVWPDLPAPRRQSVEPSGQPPLVLLGASTGGPEALAAVLTHLQPGFPGAVLIAQHIAPEFAPGLVDWLSARCRLPVRAAREGEPPARGTVLLAATNDHLEIAADLALHYSVSPANYAYRPSADVLFISGGAVWPRTGIAVLLTGMGTDGAEGMSRLRSLGWHTIAQDESTCVVYGMPRAAVERHAAVETLPLSLIGPTIAAKVHSNLMGRDKR